jgi:hypothetical protein
MRIAVTTIATGKYDIFIDGLVESCDKYFLPGLEKKYFVFTDSVNIGSPKNVIRVEQKKLGWPFDTIMRFHMFNSIKKQLEEFDYIFFMNANMKVVSTVGSSILETPRGCGLIVTLHPGFYLKDKKSYPLERNPMSSFYFPKGKEKNYFQGCFNGGKSNEFLKMSEELSRLIDSDLGENIMPIWHDESALNWYMMGKNPKILDPTFAYPDSLAGDPVKDLYLKGLYYEIIKKFGDPKIIQLDKDDFGGKKKLRENNTKRQ